MTALKTGDRVRITHSYSDRRWVGREFTVLRPGTTAGDVWLDGKSGSRADGHNGDFLWFTDNVEKVSTPSSAESLRALSKALFAYANTVDILANLAQRVESETKRAEKLAAEIEELSKAV